MIVTGSCAQYLPTMSTTPGSSANPPSRVDAVSSTRSRSESTRRLVNTEDTVLR